MGQFWAVLVRMEDRRECSDRKIVSRCREQARRVYYGGVFEAKKEIPAKGCDWYVNHSANVLQGFATASHHRSAVKWGAFRRELAVMSNSER